MAGITLGNVYGLMVVTVTVDLVSVAAATSAEQAFTVPGALVGDAVFVTAPAALNAGLGIVNARVSAANTVSIRMMNATAGALDAAAGVFQVLVVRPDTGARVGVGM